MSSNIEKHVLVDALGMKLLCIKYTIGDGVTYAFELYKEQSDSFNNRFFVLDREVSDRSSWQILVEHLYREQGKLP